MEIPDDLISQLRNFENNFEGNFKCHTLLLENGPKFFELFKKYPDVVLESRLFEADVAKRIFSKEQLNNINLYLGNNLPMALKELSVLKNKRISTSKLEYLCKIGTLYLNFQNSKMEKNLVSLYKKVLTIDESQRTYEVYNFIIKCTAKIVSQALNIDCPMFYISRYRYNTNELMDCTKGNFNTKLKVATINKDLVSDNACAAQCDYFPVSKLSQIIHVVAHEVKHAEQTSDFNNKKFNNNTYNITLRCLFDRYLSTEGYSEYKKNYFYTEMEVNAEIFGWLFAEKIASEFCKNDVDAYMCSLNHTYSKYKKSLDLRRDSQNNYYQAYKYNIDNLESILKENPTELKKHSLLNIFFKKDGNLRGIVSLLNFYKELKCVVPNVKLSNLINSYSNYHFQNMPLDYISKLDEYNQKLVMSKLLDVIIFTLNNLKASFSSFLENQIYSMEFINNDRIYDLLKLFELLTYNQNVYHQLCQFDKNACKKMLAIETCLKDIKKEFEINNRIQNSDISTNLYRLCRVKILK